jgi:hypothetical protein
MMTSRYTTAEASTLDDLQCQICLGTLESCVALEPCGHNFCAACLSNHFAAQLQVSSPFGRRFVVPLCILMHRLFSFQVPWPRAEFTSRRA